MDTILFSGYTKQEQPEKIKCVRVSESRRVFH